MTGSVALDVVIGLIFIYLLYSLFASLIQEIIATSLSFRGKILEKAIARMLDDSNASSNAITDRFKTWARLLLPFNIMSLLKINGLSEAFYEHPEIKYKSEDAWHKRPSSIAADNFSKVVVDLLKGTDLQLGGNTRKKIDDTLKKGGFYPFKPNAAIKPIDDNTLLYLKSLWADSQGDEEVFKELLEKWFDQMMERTIGWYKKYTQVILLFIGLAIAVIFNVDTILIVKKLSVDPELRAAMIGQTEVYLKAHPNLEKELEIRIKTIDELIEISSSKSDSLKKVALKNYDTILAKNDSLITATKELLETDIKSVNNLMGLGWSDEESNNKECSCWYIPRPNGCNSLLGSIMGWLITALAVSMGAPFWFDLLNKLMRLRSSIQSSSQSTIKKEERIKRVG